MKYIFLLVAIILLNVYNAQAQYHTFRGRHRGNPPDALKVVGIVAIPVGAVVGLFGLTIYTLEGDVGGRGSANGHTPKPDNSGLIIAGAGGVLVVGGITLLIIDHANHKAHRWGVVAPKRNEVGLAYNF